jgi:glycosyltransferase involved in cell wall biosynthesis
VSDRLRIGIIAPPWFPVPPVMYGGIEAVVSLLADGLADAGHDVTLFASGDSQTRASLIAVYEQAPSDQIGNSSWELRHSLAALSRADEFDVIHDHTGGLVGLSLGGLIETPLVHTVHGPVDGEAGDAYASVCSLLPQAKLISISCSQQRWRPDLPWFANVPNAIDCSRYPLTVDKDDYLVFLGRMGFDKGCHRAIDVALEAGIPLKIAAKNREPHEQEYFKRFVRPRLGGTIEYLGEVGGAEKTALLSRARAMLCPIDWEEPFGLVMAESMACGTPVIACRRGAAPELVEHGITGYLVDDHREMPAALENTFGLDPRLIRGSVVKRYSPARLVQDHVSAYIRAANSTAQQARPPRANQPAHAQHRSTVQALA